MDIDKYIYELSYDTILNLAKRDLHTNNVVIGLHKYCLGVMNDDVPEIWFTYICNVGGLKGYVLKLNFKQKHFYEIIMVYCYQIALEYEHVNCVNLYNSYLNYMRTLLEHKGVVTINIDEIEGVGVKLGYSDATIVANSPIEIIPSLKAKEFYKSLLHIDEELLIEEGKNYIYLMLNERNGYFKIGRSINPRHRERTLQSEEPDIIMLGYWEKDKIVEKELHRLFSEKRLRGEWFKLNMSDVLRMQTEMTK